MTVVDVRNRQWSTDTPTERVESLRSLLCEVVDTRIEGVVLQVLEKASVILIRACLGCEGHVSHLGELCIVVERSDLQLVYSLRRWIWVYSGSAVENVGGRDTIHGEVNLVCCRSTKRNVPLTVLLHVRRGSKGCKWACGCRTEIKGELPNLPGTLRVSDRSILRIDLIRGRGYLNRGRVSGGDLECDRHTKILSCIQRNSVQRGRREPFMARGNAKVPRIHIRKQKFASAVCSDNTIGVRVRTMKRNLSARHRCTTCILRRSTNASEC